MSSVFLSESQKQQFNFVVVQGGWVTTPPSSSHHHHHRTSERSSTPQRGGGGASSSTMKTLSNKQPSTTPVRRPSATSSPALSPAGTAPMSATVAATSSPVSKARSKSRAESSEPVVPPTITAAGSTTTLRLPPWEEFRDDVLVPAVERALDIAYRNRSVFVPNGKSADGRTMAPNNRGSSVDSTRGVDSSLKGPSTPIIMRRLLSSNEGSTPSFNDDMSAAGGGGGSREFPGVIMPIVFSEDDFLLENAEILHEVKCFSAPPFTLQRMCEILLSHDAAFQAEALPSSSSSNVVSVSGAGKAEEEMAEGSGATNGGSVSKGGGKKRQRSTTPTQGGGASPPPSAFSPLISPATAATASSRIRGEKLQAALRRCALVSTAF